MNLSQNSVALGHEVWLFLQCGAAVPCSHSCVHARICVDRWCSCLRLALNGRSKRSDRVARFAPTCKSRLLPCALKGYGGAKELPGTVDTYLPCVCVLAYALPPFLLGGSSCAFHSHFCRSYILCFCSFHCDDFSALPGKICLKSSNCLFMLVLSNATFVRYIYIL